MKRKPTIREVVEAAIQDAYEIGHAHGRAPLLVMRGEAPVMADIGWKTPADRLVRQMIRRGAR
jgi:hypothetical protein